jgi:probable F420-dependent oxidoreductase
MKFFQSVDGVEADQLAALAVHADRLGFEGITFGDHLVKPVAYENIYLYSEDGRPPWDPAGEPDWTVPYVDPWTAAAGLGALTQRLRFLPYVYVLPMRHPAIVAKQLATASLFAPGRLLLGVGVGWMREEYALLDVPFEARGARMDEALHVIDGLLAGGGFGFAGRHFAIPTCRMEPIPEERIPILIGGDSDAALRRAARHDGWLGIDYALADLAKHVERLAHFRREAGRADAPFEIFAVCKEGLTRETVAAMEKLGVTMTQDYAWQFKGRLRSPLAQKLDDMTRFAETWLQASPGPA